MLNYIWTFMIIAGVIWAILHGNTAAVTQGLLDSAADAVSLCVTMLGVVSLWTGILKIGERSGLIDRLARRLEPVLCFLFPDLPEDHPARRSIAVNMIANVLGLGWAATPAGLQAMKELEELEEERRGEGGSTSGNGAHTVSESSAERRTASKCDVEKCVTSGSGAEHDTAAKKSAARRKPSAGAAPPGTASSEMCTFLIINISSLQLIPVNMIAYRSQYGSAAPAAIVGPAAAATAVSTLAAVMFCRVMNSKNGG